MTPKEKAINIIKMFFYNLPNNGLQSTGINSINQRWNEAIDCALVFVDEVNNDVLKGSDLAATWGDYWQKVKKEINESRHQFPECRAD